MKIDKPTWLLKQICPDCGQGYPEFCICPNCGFVTVSCTETGDTFIDPKILSKGFAIFCPKCNQVSTSDFIIADSESILKAGFRYGEYE